MPPSKSELAKIHIAKKKLALTDEAYRDMLWLNFQVGSARDLSNRQAMDLISIFKAKGWKPKSSSGGPRKRAGHSASGNDRFIKIKPGPAAKQQRKVLALWHALGYPMAKLHSRVEKQFGVERYEWLEDGSALHILITDLEKRLKTQGVK